MQPESDELTEVLNDLVRINDDRIEKAVLKESHDLIKNYRDAVHEER